MLLVLTKTTALKKQKKKTLEIKITLTDIDKKILQLILRQLFAKAAF